MKNSRFGLSSHRLHAAKLSRITGLAMILLLLLGLQPKAPATAQSVLVGLVTDVVGLTDMSFNWFSYQGLLRAQDELGVLGTVYTSTDPADYTTNLQQCVDDGNDLCISVGFLTAEAILTTAEANPDTLFAIVDFTWQTYPGNLRGTTFAVSESGYLAGTLAGLMTQSDVVGSVGGMQIPVVEAFVESYRDAAQCANPDATTIINYTGTFGDPDLGAQVAQEMIAQGADVIFAPAGATGSGAILAATQSGIWGIGVDTDFYLTVFMNGAVAGSDKLLSSAMKRLDNAVFDTIADVASGTFTAGTTLYDVTVDGVGLAPFHEADPFVPSTVRGRLERIRRDMIEGNIDVNGPCPAYMDPTQAVVTPTATTVFTGSGGLVTTIIAPETFAETTVITYTPQVPVDPGTNFVGIGLFYELEAASQFTGQPVQPSGVYTVTVSYLDEEVQAAQVVGESALALYYWDGDQWVKEPSSEVNTSANTITATPDHFSLWAVLSEKHQVFLPVVLSNH